MKIRTSLSLLSVTFIILIIIIGFIMFHAFGRMNEEIAEAHSANKIIKDIFELNIVTSDYLIHHEKRMGQQWRLKYNSLGKLLKEMRKKERHSEHVPISEALVADYKMLGSLFVQLQDNLAKKEQLIKENRPQSEINIVLILKERLVAQSLKRSQRISAVAFKLSTEIEQKITQHQKNANLLILFSIIGFAIFSSYISFLTIKVIIRPISELMKGIEIIGKGYLEHRIVVRVKNEMGTLAVAFNEMIKKRKQAEEELKSANQQLQASNQQLRANEQQLRAEIAEREKAEDKIRRLSSAVQQSPSIAVITGTNGDIEYINPKFSEITGYAYEETIGKSSRILKSGETTLEAYKRMWGIITSGAEWRGIFHNKKKSGELYWEAASISSIKDGEGTITHFIKVAEDITERVKMEKETEKHLNDLEVFYKASKGREERIIELKKRVKELEAKLDKKTG